MLRFPSLPCPCRNTVCCSLMHQVGENRTGAACAGIQGGACRINCNCRSHLGLIKKSFGDNLIHDGISRSLYQSAQCHRLDRQGHARDEPGFPSFQIQEVPSCIPSAGISVLSLILISFPRPCMEKRCCRRGYRDPVRQHGRSSV